LLQKPEIFAPEQAAGERAAAATSALTIGGLGPTSLAVPQSLRDAARSAGQYIAAAKAPAPRRAYEADLRHFAAWCDGHALAALPATPDTVT
jgi:hypothetical protein